MGTAAKCPRCEGNGSTTRSTVHPQVCRRCWGTGKDLIGLLADKEADLADLRVEYERYSALVDAAETNGARKGRTYKLDALKRRGKELRAETDKLRALVSSLASIGGVDGLTSL